MNERVRYLNKLDVVLSLKQDQKLDVFVCEIDRSNVSLVADILIGIMKDYYNLVKSFENVNQLIITAYNNKIVGTDFLKFVRNCNMCKSDRMRLHNYILRYMIAKQMYNNIREEFNKMEYENDIVFC